MPCESLSSHSFFDCSDSGSSGKSLASRRCQQSEAWQRQLTPSRAGERSRQAHPHGGAQDSGSGSRVCSAVHPWKGK